MAKKRKSFNERIDELTKFAHNNQRWPSTISKDEEEKTLGSWWSRNKYYYNQFKAGKKAPGMNEEKAKEISKLLIVFENFERDAKWQLNYDKVKDRIEKHEKLWPYKTENEEEQQILRWWNQQKNFARKFIDGKETGGMNQKRFKLVKKLQDKIGDPLVKDYSNAFTEIMGFYEDSKKVKE